MASITYAVLICIRPTTTDSSLATGINSPIPFLNQVVPGFQVSTMYQWVRDFKFRLSVINFRDGIFLLKYAPEIAPLPMKYETYIWPYIHCGVIMTGQFCPGTKPEPLWSVVILSGVRYSWDRDGPSILLQVLQYKLNVSIIARSCTDASDFKTEHRGFNSPVGTLPYIDSYRLGSTIPNVVSGND